ncbi:methyltransferase [Photorhabdus temperata]|uniref:Hydroxyneurosporene-O-methyltransferase n=1 Tax=Photorhabdus temperata subsp. temperata Meg1 TaxID=1393735 RepID=A0A081RX97_PHOTE|nr:methyltransferase [Photorhabdus temperata]KER03300.1 hydroxyneurosporene-O-methyltransferase [Photorhabdus temperata subsp. temperata Meg1]MCT8349103.1 methyltransferase [Photorhabdus temperata]
MLIDLITSHRKTAAIYALVDTGLSVHFKDGACVDIDELSRKSGIDNSRLNQLCDYLIEIGVLISNNHGITLSDECSALADPESIESLLIKYETNQEHWNSWVMYSKSLRENNGKSAFEMVYGKPIFEHLANNKSLREDFDALMTKNSNTLIQNLLNVYDFNIYNRMLDVGGAKGHLLESINEKVKGKHYAVLDRYNELPVSEDIDFINGDFMKSIPSGYDLYILMNIIHNWNDDGVISILKNCRKAMDDDATVLLISVMKKPQSPIANSMSILMDMLFLSKERYLTEVEDLANQAGLTIKDTKDIDETFSTIELKVK